ncbi:hypothetical protein F5Y16DRAFT_351449 [Xylariaceae sp. FL0255]|nr:hypothetical protein F5Y16DRAFT_351449 [Xylariaceae sp. FL0255]
MVSFSCEECGDVLTKKKLDPHRNRCRAATFTCIDCMVHFPGTEYRSHTSCMTEDQKYQGALYKPKKQKQNQAVEESTQADTMAHHAYVEDVTEGYEPYQYQVGSEGEDQLLPKAPTPPPAVAVDITTTANVFDYMLDPTPNASHINLQPLPSTMGMCMGMGMGMGMGGRQLVRFDDNVDEYVDEVGYMVDDDAMGQYSYETPAPKAHRKKVKDSEKKDKKRKRLRIDTSPQAMEIRNDEEMTDAPPVLHSGLTGGLKSMMRSTQFPPSPDYSGGDAPPASPIKKKKTTKSTKTSRPEGGIGSNLKALISGSSKSKVSKKRKHPSEKKEKKRKTHRSSSEKAPKLIEFTTKSGDEKEGESGALIVFKPRSDLFLSLCNKGPESDRGCSVNKALKRFHRERKSSGTSLGKVEEEKELWRSLRMRRNERGEIVLFSLDGTPL